MLTERSKKPINHPSKGYKTEPSLSCVFGKWIIHYTSKHLKEGCNLIDYTDHTVTNSNGFSLTFIKDYKGYKQFMVLMFLHCFLHLLLLLLLYFQPYSFSIQPKKQRDSLEPATNDLLSSFSIHLFIDQTQKEKLNNIEHI